MKAERTRRGWPEWEILVGREEIDWGAPTVEIKCPECEKPMVADTELVLPVYDPFVTRPSLCENCGAFMTLSKAFRSIIR
jgi:hypothetical protein